MTLRFRGLLFRTDLVAVEPPDIDQVITSAINTDADSTLFETTNGNVWLLVHLAPC